MLTKTFSGRQRQHLDWFPCCSNDRVLFLGFPRTEGGIWSNISNYKPMHVFHTIAITARYLQRDEDNGHFVIILESTPICFIKLRWFFYPSGQNGLYQLPISIIIQNSMISTFSSTRIEVAQGTFCCYFKLIFRKCFLNICVFVHFSIIKTPAAPLWGKQYQRLALFSRIPNVEASSGVHLATNPTP